MAETTEQLIARLAANVAPVRRLRSPLLRAACWLLGVAAIAAVGIIWFSDLEEFSRRAQDPRLVLEMAATLATGITAVIAAFYLSLPDRAFAWALLPIPPLALWIITSGYNCYDKWISYGAEGWTVGESANCFRFILASSIPLGITLLLMLRRARPLAPIRVATMAGIGVGAVSAFLLQFFHPFDVTFMDLAVHAVAIAIVVSVSSASGRIGAGA